jgi:hypothetical protein
MLGRYDIGAGLPARTYTEDSMHFSRGGLVNAPRRSFVMWFLTQYRRFGYVKQDLPYQKIADQLILRDLYEEVAQEEKIPVPDDDLAPFSIKLDNAEFDPRSRKGGQPTMSVPKPLFNDFDLDDAGIVEPGPSLIIDDAPRMSVDDALPGLALGKARPARDWGGLARSIALALLGAAVVINLWGLAALLRPDLPSPAQVFAELRALLGSPLHYNGPNDVGVFPPDRLLARQGLRGLRDRPRPGGPVRGRARGQQSGPRGIQPPRAGAPPRLPPGLVPDRPRAL